VALETVRVIVYDTEVPPGVIENVTVRVFTTAEVFVTSAVTNASGIADVTLDGALTGTDYHVRFHKDTVSFDTPQVIAVYSPAGAAPNGTNDFEAEGDLNAPSAPSEATLCRCYGYFRNVDGTPIDGMQIRFQSNYSPMIYNGLGVYGSPIYLETDSDGYASIDLYRNSELMVSLAGEHIEEDLGYQRNILVPDRTTCSLLDLLFPVVIQVTWSPVAPFSLTVGGTLEVTPTITATNYQVLTGAAPDDVLYEVSDASIASVSTNNDTIILTGVSVGATSLTVTRRDDSIVRVPDTITGTPATINVT